MVTARTRETLEQIVKPAVVGFLASRGLELSEQKTTITHIETGFNFLGQNVRKYKNKLVIKPAKDGTKAKTLHLQGLSAYKAGNVTKPS